MRTQTTPTTQVSASHAQKAPPDSAVNFAVNDRRKHRRFRVERPGKVCRASIQQFAPARSRDLSFGGALLEVQSPRPFQVGELIDLGLSMNKAAVVPSTALVQGIVVRADTLDDSRQSIAVRYVNAGVRSHAA